MSDIKTFPFNIDKLDQIKKYEFGLNWPVVYILENGKDAYVGETIRTHKRIKEHLENPVRKDLKKVHLISDQEYNVSATLDIESWLIQYISAEGSFLLQNGNDGLRNHQYFDKEKYKAEFEIIWRDLQNIGLVKKDLVQIRNSDLFKYSPYKSLTEDQIIVAEKLVADIKTNQKNTFIVNGKPGTGKTIIAVYLVKYLKEQESTKHMEVALVVPMTQLRGTIRKVFSKVRGLKSSMVIGPNDVTKKKYDVLIVDEAHRLKQRRQITNYASFDITNKKFGLDNRGTELDWIMKSSKHQILFYDKNQSVRPADLSPDMFSSLDSVKYDLVSQMRVAAGEEYTNFIDDIFDLQDVKKYKFPKYDLKIYDDIHKMVSDIKQKDSELHLCRMVAGYAWEWKSRNNSSAHDIEINGLKLVWNSTNQDWVNSKNAVNEVGCIHTVQGYDLNYVGVIIGPELSYDENKKELLIKADNYKDANGWRGVTDPEELKRYIINIYKTLLTRGIKGTYIYVVDEKLRKFLKDKMQNFVHGEVSIQIKEDVVSPYNGLMVELPLYESVGCGELMIAQSVPEETIKVKKDYLSGGSKYFVLRVTGDSMNKAGINDGDLVLCQKNYHPVEGNKVVALIGDDATIKIYTREGDNVVLKPSSTNPEHKDIIFTDNSEISVQGVVIRVLKREINN
jgi:DUF2075 family protein